MQLRNSISEQLAVGVLREEKKGREWKGREATEEL
jgi:hypothetical protein